MRAELPATIANTCAGSVRDTETTVFDTSPIPITREIAPLNAAAVDFLLTILFKLNKLNLLAS